MKKVLTLLTACAVAVASAQAQDEMVYRRSSLHQIYIPCQSKIGGGMLAKAAGMGIDIPASAQRDFTPEVTAAMAKYPFPDKYNNHEIAMKSLTLPESLLADDEDGEETEEAKSKEEVDKTQLAIEQAIVENQVAKELVKKWFNYNNGKFDMNLVGERGMYNASEMQAAIAKGQARGLASLADAGEELIGNTFVAFSYTKFTPCIVQAELTRAAALAAASQLPSMAQGPAIAAAEKLYDKMKDGYAAVTKTYLYKLVWDEETAAKFFNEFYNNPEAFEADKTTFKMEFVGVGKSRSVAYPKKEDSAVVERLVIRNTDKMYADLGKNYEVFKPKSPVLTGAPVVTAQIGKKEGLEGGEKFDVLEMTFDKKEGKTTWKVVGTVTADKKRIWDNRYAAGQEEGETVDESVKATVFKGKAVEGNYLRQQK